jgi:predicted DCC family thiol-disulfide oxidoreductase YuxK
MPPTSTRPEFLGPDDRVVLFDGVCNLCNGAVQFLLPRDRGGRLKFASAQSEAGQALLKWCGLPTDRLDTMAFIENGRAYTRSTAVARIARYLKWPWHLLSLALVIPQPVRDWFYDRIALNRYNIFGKSESCLFPTPDVARRFL